MTDKSCRGCKFLYGEGSGYSNYTWMETFVRCALGNNLNLANNREAPYGWKDPDAWPPTMNSRCERYAPGPYIVTDPDLEDRVGEYTDDAEVIALICAQTGAKP